jgi:hypothetical protein
MFPKIIASLTISVIGDDMPPAEDGPAARAEPATGAYT